MTIGTITNFVVLLIFSIAAVAYAVSPDSYYAFAQEDRFLEWLTFWAFLAAAVVFVRNAAVDRGLRGGLPWFAVGLGLFCGFVAFEEISWGQRLFGYRPPDYFLKENFQQELNLHNIVGTDLRMLGMQVVLVGYGVVLALICAIPGVARVASKWRVVAPPPALVPAFGLSAIVYAWYPADFTGEWVEAATGYAFLGVALASAPAVNRRLRVVVLHNLAIALASASTLGLITLVYGSDAARTAQSQREVEALAADFRGPRLRTRCGIHKRLYTFMLEYRQPFLSRGEFASLVQDYGEPTRAEYLLDPWNSPYWVRHRCADDRVVAFVYSFGPNRLRDSTEWELAGDDIGAYIQQR